MHTNVLVTRHVAYPALKQSVHAGDVHFVLGLPGVRDLADHARAFVRDAFGTLDPQLAQYDIDVARFAELAANLKESFTHDSLTDNLTTALAVGLGADPETTYFDRPRLRVAPSDDYLTSGVSYAYKPHRDTWYGNPAPTVNLWFPLFEVDGDSVMSFWFHKWQVEVPNTGYDHDAWVRDHRFRAVELLEEDRRPHPLPLEDVGPWDLRLVPGVGDTLAFSACHLHATAPNRSGRTRFSVDVRFLSRGDLAGSDGGTPRDVDSKVVGMQAGEFRLVSDLSAYPV